MQGHQKAFIHTNTHWNYVFKLFNFVFQKLLCCCIW